MQRILFICHGNICRSTMAESVMKYLVGKAGRADEFRIDSAATSMEEIGNPPHPGTVAALRAAGIPVAEHRARRMRAEEYGAWDRIIYMDEENRRGLERILRGSAAYAADGGARLEKLLAYASDGPLDPTVRSRSGHVRDVADPWYTGNFDATFRDIMAGCRGLLAAL